MKDLPNSKRTHLYGVLAVTTFLVYAVPGIIFGIMAIKNAKKDINLYKNQKDQFSKKSFQKVKSGKKMGISI